MASTPATAVNLGKLARKIFRNRFVAVHELTEVCIPAINRNKQKLLEILRGKTEIASKTEWARKLRVAKEYFKLEMAPPNSAEEMKKLTSDLVLAKEFIQTGAFKFMTVKQLWLLFLVVLEVGLWFFLGETIGKMHIVGYKV